MSKLFIVSTGPGDSQLVAPRAHSAIAASTDLVAYGLYLDILGNVCDGKQHHDLPLGEEIGRARLALDLGI
jgi:precorrin-3B C17-methyltransferase